MRTIRDQAAGAVLALGLMLGAAVPAAADQVTVAKLPIDVVAEPTTPAEPPATSGSSSRDAAPAPVPAPPPVAATREREAEATQDRRAWMLLLLGLGPLPYGTR